ncbi:hypothetical protein [Nocardioides pakistanensis]
MNDRVSPKTRFTASTRFCDLGCGRAGTELVGEKGGSVLLTCPACARALIEPIVPASAVTASVGGLREHAPMLLLGLLCAAAAATLVGWGTGSTPSPTSAIGLFGLTAVVSLTVRRMRRA